MPRSDRRHSRSTEGMKLGRFGRPEEIAAAALFLLETGTAVSGQVLSPNAGATI